MVPLKRCIFQLQKSDMVTTRKNHAPCKELGNIPGDFFLNRVNQLLRELNT